MFYMLLITFFIYLIFFVFIFINFVMSKKFYKSRDKLTIFECGFDNMSMFRMPFSLNFYIITIIFLIFDIEVSLILPLVKLFFFSFFWYKFYFFLFLLYFLLLGLYIEWYEGVLCWYL